MKKETGVPGENPRGQVEMVTDPHSSLVGVGGVTNDHCSRLNSQGV